MKHAALAVVILVGAIVVLAALQFAVAPLFLNSRIERLGETNVPKIVVEKRSTIYCRMKADDFRFPLPPGSRAVNPVVTGVFDTVDGSVEARFDGTNEVTASEYTAWLSSRIRAGAEIKAQPIPGGLLVKFHYFGDR